jgi:hypothetical protein
MLYWFRVGFGIILEKVTVFINASNHADLLSHYFNHKMPQTNHCSSLPIFIFNSCCRLVVLDRGYKNCL